MTPAIAKTLAVFLGEKEYTYGITNGEVFRIIQENLDLEIVTKQDLFYALMVQCQKQKMFISVSSTSETMAGFEWEAFLSSDNRQMWLRKGGSPLAALVSAILAYSAYKDYPNDTV